MIKDADISENQLLVGYGEKVCMNLLKDHTTQQNIYWATDSYSDLGDDFTFFAPITLDKITSYISDNGIVITNEKYKELVKENPEVKGKYQEIIRPRSVKSREEQTQRAKDKAEVFTPAWICNAQNNLIDEAWFGRKEGLFNSPDPNDPHKWINNKEKIIFPEDKTWKDYVADMRLEITCGEAPYLCNRYDAVSGEYNDEVKYRIGLLDRKLRIVSENTKDSKEWILWAKIALRSTYGFEWQGDNLLLARLNLFFTLFEYYHFKFGEDAPPLSLEQQLTIANIISWNLWQMDGLKGVIPDSCKGSEPIGLDLFGEVSENTSGCRGCQTGNIREHNGMYCKIKDWHYVPKRRKAKSDSSVTETGVAQDPWQRGTEKVIRFIDMIGQ